MATINLISALDATVDSQGGRSWLFQGSAQVPYTTTHSENGLMSCTCKGWTFRRHGKPRECKHITYIIEQLGLTRIIKGEYVFAEHDGTASVVVAGPRSTEVSEGTVERALELADGQTTPKAGRSVPAPMLASTMVLNLPSGATAEQIMAATQAEVERIAAAGTHILEEKEDGHRVEVDKQGETVTFWSRPRQGEEALQRDVPAHIRKAVMALPDGIYDGELKEPGGNSWDVARMSNTLLFVMFDVLECMGTSLMDEPQTARREAVELACQIAESASIVPCLQQEVSWANVEAIWDRGGEGAILKLKTGKYVAGWRTPHWVKVVRVATVTMTVTGFIEKKLGPYSVLALSGPQPIKSVKNKDNNWLAEASPEWIGRRIVIQYTPRGGKPMHPRVDHWAGEGE